MPSRAVHANLGYSSDRSGLGYQKMCLILIISSNIEKCSDAFRLMLKFWDSLFWVVHADGRFLMGFNVNRHQLAESGNVASACALFVLDGMRKRSYKGKKNDTLEMDRLQWGVY